MAHLALHDGRGGSRLRDPGGGLPAAYDCAGVQVSEQRGEFIYIFLLIIRICFVLPVKSPNEPIKTAKSCSGLPAELLISPLFRLIRPRVEGFIFDAYTALSWPDVEHGLLLILVLLGGELLIGLAGKVTLQLFGRRAMRQLFQR